MVDYFSPTAVQLPIPLTDITPLKRLVLSLVFDAEPDNDVAWLHSDTGPSDMIAMPIEQLRATCLASLRIYSAIAVHLTECLAAAPADDTEIEPDLSGVSRVILLQDIVRRSSTLAYITVVTAFTCSKTRVDGFGGMAILITAAAIRSMSPHDIEFLAARDARGALDHVLRHLSAPRHYCSRRLACRRPRARQEAATGSMVRSGQAQDPAQLLSADARVPS
ncbi:hypothetical protein [Hyphomicrobium sp. CS1BSMeth3]|uniref:hypothetical protein n=1 Tax=Hyphomicrobium sp. CS1BSMeth3 TaxID=1892844 RepID=UPI001AECC0E8|nr:hypothetical protein [Hyphomicrobium sp. CS1BSMeth3]